MSLSHSLPPAWAGAVLAMALAAAPARAAVPTVSVSDARVVEGASGQSLLQFEVVANGPPRRLTLGYTLGDLTATASSGDYAAGGGLVTLEPEPPRLMGQLGVGTLSVPTGVALAPNGDVIAVDGPSGRVLRFSSVGVLLSSFAVPSPRGVAVSADGYILVTTLDGRVNMYHSNGSVMETWGTPGSNRGYFNMPSGIVVDREGYVHVADTGNNRIQVFGTFDAVMAAWSTHVDGEPEHDWPLGIAVDAEGSTFVSKAVSGHILKYGTDGRLLATWTDTKGHCRGDALHFDDAGNLLIADGLAGRIVVLDPQGAFLTEWTTDEVSTTSVVSDHTGNVYVGTRSASSIAHYRWVDRSVGSIVVPVSGDATFEADETLELRLEPNANASLLDGVAIGTITNDDPQLGPDQVANGHFESGLQGWGAYAGATLATSPDGIGGSNAARATGTTTKTFGLNDTPNLILSTPTGARYRYSARVRSTGSGSAWLRVREYLSGVLQASTVSTPLAFDGSWQLVEVVARARTTGATLDFQIVGDFTTNGQQFLIDDVALQPLGADVPPVAEAPPVVAGSWTRDIVVEVSAHDPEGDPIEALEADVSGLPGATFTVTADRTHGTLRWRPRFEDVRYEPHVVTFTARNALVSVASTRIRVDPNLALNPSFELDESGWNGHLDATLARVEGGRRDGHAARLTLPSSDWAGITDSPNWAAPAGFNRLFVFGAWVRSDSLRGPVRVQVREYEGATLLGTATAIGGPIDGGALTSSWRHLLLAYTCVSSGPSELDLSIAAQGATGETFDVDDVTIIGMAASSSVGVEDAPPLALAARVFPNPARGNMTLELALPTSGRLRVELYDIAGRRRAVIADEARAEAGMRRYALRAPEGPLAPGVYWYRASFGNAARQGRFVVLE